jgi:hypothetical protein
MDDRGSIPGRGKIFLFSTASRSALGPTRPPIRGAQGAIFPRVKRLESEADHLHLVPRSRKMELYLHSPTCLHGIVINLLITGTTLFLVLLTCQMVELKEKYATLEQTTIYTLAIDSYITNSSRMW